MACEKFSLQTQRISHGKYAGILSVRSGLNYEISHSYTLAIQAEDSAEQPGASLTSTATITVNILDVQDQPPVFINAPYRMVINENSPAGMSVSTIFARDGDTGQPRQLQIDIINDSEVYFQIKTFQMEGDIASALVATTENKIDRESDIILMHGGVYTFGLKVRNRKTKIKTKNKKKKQ